jgi:peptidoglycan/LPS O-acetylase OafA/YrhL
MMNEPKSRGWLPCLTGLRGVTAVWIVLFHFGRLSPLPRILYCYGGQMLSCFFILSGIVLAYSYSEAVTAGTVGWFKFFNLRLARIVPVHVVTWLIATVLHLGFAWNYSVEVHPWASWLAGLLCLQIYWPTQGLLYKWNAPSWSISCELFFYALFPFLVPALGRWMKSKGSAIVTMFCLWFLEVILFLGATWIVLAVIHSGHSFLGYRTYGEAKMGVLHVFPLLRLSEFLIGMCIGMAALRWGPLLTSARNANLALGFGMAAILVLTQLPGLTSRTAGIQAYPLFIGFLVLMLVALMSGRTILTTFLNSRPIVFLGEISYSLYLVHCFFYPGQHPSQVVYVLCFLGSIASAIVLYFLVERPARGFWRKFIKKSSVSQVSPFKDLSPSREGLGVNHRIEVQN